MSGKQLLKIALDNGFKLDRVNGSHHVLVKDNITVTIPVHSNKDIPIGTANKILKQIGLR